MSVCKRLFDVLFSALGLLAASPLMLAAAVLVKLEDGGPVFFLHERVGRNFRPFRVVKFRTMEASPAAGPQITSASDPRITRVGRHLRKTKLDELPQLINVLRGEMSLVGPRPETAGFVQAFRDKYEEILRVRPGITDPASIAYRHEEDILKGVQDPEAYYISEILPRKLDINLRYVRERSMLGDVRIILRTIAVLAKPAMAKPRHQPAGDECIPCLPEGPTGSRLAGLVVKYRSALVFCLFAVSVAAADYLAFYIRFDGKIDPYYLGIVPYSVSMALAVRLPLYYAFGLHHGMWRYAGISDLRKIAVSTTIGTLIMATAFSRWDLGPMRYPYSVMLLDWILATGFTGGIRVALRVYKEYRISRSAGKRRTLIIGAGEAGERIVRDMRSNASVHNPIGFIDDDTSKKGLSIHDVRVLGTREDLSRVMEECRPDEILLAIPSARPRLLQDMIKELTQYSLPIQTLPKMGDILDGRVSVDQIRPVDIEYLLGRPLVKAESGMLHGFIQGKSVMVTGAGGSIGSEICRQACGFGAGTVVAYERHENSLYNLEMEISRQRPSVPLHPVIGDVNDTHRLDETIERFAPDIIFHAAAHKHVPMMEQNPREAIYNNILGTRNAALAAGRHGVKRFLLISTDKAVNPTSIMGASKRACELMAGALGQACCTKYITVRFGNVMGSSGSVVPLFKEQIKSGGPVTVTHPEVERFLMLIPEAVQLVIQAASLGKGGEIFVLNMGTPVRIDDLARSMITLSGFEPKKDIDIEYVGLRPGEKLREDLFHDFEEVALTPLGRVFMAVSPERPDYDTVTRFCERLEECVARKDTPGMIEELCRMVKTYRPQPCGGELRRAA